MKQVILLLNFCFILLVSVNAKDKEHKLHTSKSQNKNQDYNMQPKEATHILFYDNKEIGEGVGTSTAFTLGMAIEFPSNEIQDLVGERITHIRFGMEDNTAVENASIEIYEDSMSSVPMYYEDIPVGDILSGYNTFKLDEFYTINESKDLFIVVNFEALTAGYLGTIDTDGSQSPELGGHIFFNDEYIGTLSQNGIDGDWNLQAIITDDGEYNGIKDLALLDAKTQSPSCTLSQNEEIIVSIINLGDSISTDTVKLIASLNNSELSYSIPMDSLMPKDTLFYNLPPNDLSALQAHKLNLELVYVDIFQENNFLSKSFISGDATITVNLLTDGNPEETSWFIYDKLGNTIAQNTALESFTQYTEEICALSNDCYSFVIHDTYGDGLSDPNEPGNFVIKFNDDTIASSPNDGNFGYVFHSPTLGNGCPNNNVVLEEHFIPNEAPVGDFPLLFKITNQGKDTLSSIELLTIINEKDSSIEAISNLMLLPNESIALSASDPLIF